MSKLELLVLFQSPLRGFEFVLGIVVDLKESNTAVRWVLKCGREESSRCRHLVVVMHWEDSML